MQIDQLHLEWTEDEDDEDTCHVCRNINSVTNDIYSVPRDAPILSGPSLKQPPFNCGHVCFMFYVSPGITGEMVIFDQTYFSVQIY